MMTVVSFAMLLLAVLSCTVRADYVSMAGHSLEAYPNAKCLDGSPAMYYYYAPNNASNKWFIELQGGGWCSNANTCGDRAKTQFGSSTSWKATTLRKTPFFSDDSAENPLMHDWNRVYFRYCDGFGFIGNQPKPYLAPDGKTQLHVRGFEILQAGIQEMIQKHKLGDATDVIVGGCSAGGLSALWTCDTWSDQIRAQNPDAQVKCASDSGFFINYQPKDSKKGTYFDLMKEGLDFHNPVLSASCNKSDPAECLLAENVVPHMKSSIFIMQPRYDSWARGPIQLSNDDHDEVNAYGALLTQTVRTVVMSANGQNGIYLDSCTRHGCDGYEVAVDGVTKMQALKVWYEASNQVGPDVYIQDEVYPCEKCCVGTAMPTSPPSQAPSAAPSASPSSTMRESYKCNCPDDSDSPHLTLEDDAFYSGTVTNHLRGPPSSGYIQSSKVATIAIGVVGVYFLA